MPLAVGAAVAAHQGADETRLPIAVGFGVKDAVSAKCDRWRLPTASWSAPRSSTRCGVRLDDGRRCDLAYGRSGSWQVVRRHIAAGVRAAPTEIERHRVNWIDNVVPPKIRSFLKRDTPENLWVKCPESGELVFRQGSGGEPFRRPGIRTTTCACPIKARLAMLFGGATGYEEIGDAGRPRATRCDSATSNATPTG